MAFTRLDRNLLVRVGKVMAQAAGAADAKVAAARDRGDLKLAGREKTQADILHRDLRDLEELRKRLEKACLGAVTMLPLEQKGGAEALAGTAAGGPANPGSAHG